MATLFCDFENGNDNYAGSSFALLASGTDGRIIGATFSSAGATFPNDGSLIGQYLSIFNGAIYAVVQITAWVSSTSLTFASISGGTTLANQAQDRQYYIGGRWKSLTTGATGVRVVPGDTVRIMGSPAPTSLGQDGVWTSQALQGTQSIASSTNATPISITRNAHGYSTGDTVVITGHTANTNANGTWEITVTSANTFTLDGSAGNGAGGTSGTVRLRNNSRVMLTTAVTQNIAGTGPRSAWTSADATNVTTSISLVWFKEHGGSDRAQVSTGFATGKVAYYTLPVTLDLSAYQQVSFWFFYSGGPSALTAGQIELRLCSDTTGDIAVNTIALPAIATASKAQAVTVDLGAPLGASISSISVHFTADLTTTQAIFVYLNNIIACKASSAADSLTLSSLIGKNTTGETFWGIQSINGRRVMLDLEANTSPIITSWRGYYGTSETVTTYKRETIKLGPSATINTVLQTLSEGGADGSFVTYSGGWDRTNMSTQTLETWLDGVNGNGYAIYGFNKSYIALEKLAFVRFVSGLFCDSINLSRFDIIAANNNSSLQSSPAIYAPGYQNNLTIDHAVANNTVAVGKGTASISSSGFTKINHGILSNGTHGLDVGLQAELVNSNAVTKGTGIGLIANNVTYGIRPLAGAVLISYLTIEANGNNASISANAAGHRTAIVGCFLNDTTEVGVFTGSEIFYSHDTDQVTGNHKIFMANAMISAATDQRKTASGISWKIQPSSLIRNSSFPVSMSLAKVACAANNLVTVKAWMRRDNSGLTMRLVCKGGQIAGVTDDVIASVTTTNAWEEETITFTPTEAGVVEITAEAWGGITFTGWVDDLTISQA